MSTTGQQFVLRKEGYPSSRFVGFWGDIPDFLEVIRKQGDGKKRRHQMPFCRTRVNERSVSYSRCDSDLSYMN